jgi:hypothetical protein
MLGGAAIIIRQVANNDHATRWEWLLGLLVLMLARFTLLYIPYIRGYVSWHGDNISHWGLLKDVLTTGHLYAENYYPVTHSILAQTILVTGIPVQLVANLSTALMSVLFIAGTYLLAKSVPPFRGPRDQGRLPASPPPRDPSRLPPFRGPRDGSPGQTTVLRSRRRPQLRSGAHCWRRVRSHSPTPWPRRPSVGAWGSWEGGSSRQPVRFRISYFGLRACAFLEERGLDRVAPEFGHPP